MSIPTNMGSFDAEHLLHLLNQKHDLLEALTTRTARHPQSFYPIIIKFITGMEMAPEIAEKHYFNILEHKYLVSEKLGRDIGFRIAAGDYFVNISPSLNNPILLENNYFQKIINLSNMDPKTNCYNAKFFRQSTNIELRRSTRYDMQLSLILIDIDNFKAVNDNFGHLFGDRILLEFTETIKSSIRGEDILSRFGGDEFALLLPQTGRIGARCLAERIRYRLMERLYSEYGKAPEHRITFSGGIATFPHDGMSYEELVEHADQALYKSKSLGKNRIYDFLNEGDYEHPRFEEKRRFSRFRISKKNLAFFQVSQNNEKLEASIKNISASGILLHCQVPDIHALLTNKLTIDEIIIGDARLNKLDLHGNIVRLKNGEQGLALALQFDAALSREFWEQIESAASLFPA